MTWNTWVMKRTRATKEVRSTFWPFFFLSTRECWNPVLFCFAVLFATDLGHGFV